MRYITLLLIALSLTSCTIEVEDVKVPIFEEMARSIKYADQHHILEPYVEAFMNDARERGFDVSHVERMQVKFTDIPRYGDGSPVYGIAHGIFDEEAVVVWIDWEMWNRSYMAHSPYLKTLLIYHELGHDVFGLHHEGDQDDIMVDGGLIENHNHLRNYDLDDREEAFEEMIERFWQSI